MCQPTSACHCSKIIRIGPQCTRRRVSASPHCSSELQRFSQLRRSVNYAFACVIASKKNGVPKDFAATNVLIVFAPFSPRKGSACHQLLSHILYFSKTLFYSNYVIFTVIRQCIWDPYAYGIDLEKTPLRFHHVCGYILNWIHVICICGFRRSSPRVPTMASNLRNTSSWTLQLPVNAFAWHAPTISRDMCSVTRIRNLKPKSRTDESFRAKH